MWSSKSFYYNLNWSLNPAKQMRKSFSVQRYVLLEILLNVLSE